MIARIIISMVAVLGLTAGCGAAVKTIAQRSASERSDVFMEVERDEAPPSGFADVLITASIKTHLEGYYKGDSKASAHGKEDYPFLFNIDGQAALWRAEGKRHELPRYVDGKTNKDPEAGEGIKYVLHKKIRLRSGSHTVFFGLPEEGYYREIMINLKEGEAQTLEFNPRYSYKTYPLRLPTYLKGVCHYDVLVNDNLVAQ